MLFVGVVRISSSVWLGTHCFRYINTLATLLYSTYTLLYSAVGYYCSYRVLWVITVAIECCGLLL